MRKFLYGLAICFSVGAALALAQEYGPRSGPVTWSFLQDGGFLQGVWSPQIIDGGFAAGADGGVCADGGTSCNSCSGTCALDGGWIDGGFLYDGGFFDAGIQLECCVDGGYGTWQGPYTCITYWDAGAYDPGSGDYEDGGFHDGGCTDAGVISNGNWIDGGLFDAGVQIVQKPSYQQDAGYGDGGYNAIAENGYTWLPVSAAILQSGIASDPVSLAGFNTAAGLHASFNVSANSGAAVAGTLCVQTGYPAPANQWLDAGLCLVLNGGTNAPYTFDVGAIYAPALRWTYVPGAGSDGGYLYGTFSVTNY